MASYKGRSIDYSRPVRVHWNWHKKVYSVVQNGLVVAHCPRLVLTEVTTYTSAAGRARVLRERSKNVHSFLIGRFFLDEEFLNEGEPNWFGRALDLHREITYNPYKYSGFVYRDTEALITKKLEAVYCTVIEGRTKVWTIYE